MRVLITGAGRAGLTVAAELRDAGHDVSVIDLDETVVRRALERHGLVAFTGDATDAALLHEAEIERNDVVVAMLRRDAENLAVALLARAAGVKRIMVRMRDTAYRQVYVEAAVDRILSETEVFVGALVTSIEHAAVRQAMIVGAGDTVAFELAVPAESAIVGSTVGDIASMKAWPTTCVFAAISHPSSGYLPPRGGTIIEGGSTVLLVARRDEVAAVVDLFMKPRV